MQLFFCCSGDIFSGMKTFHESKLNGPIAIGGDVMFQETLQKQISRWIEKSSGLLSA